MKAQIKNYTLVEILAAMAVFMIICLVVMRFFSGAQRVMVNTSNSNDLHADVRVFFDIIGRDLQSIVYNNKIGVEGIYPFAHSYYKYGSSPLDQTDNIKTFYQDIIPPRLQSELSDHSDFRDYAPLLCFISNQLNLPREANFETCEIRYTFVPAGIDGATYYYRESKTPNSPLLQKFSGGALLRSCTFSDSKKTSSSDISAPRHPHDFSAFPVVDSLGVAVPAAKNRIYQVFNDTNTQDNSSGKFAQVIGGVYRMNISCFKMDSSGEIKKIKMFDVNNPVEIPVTPNLRKEFTGDLVEYLIWPPNADPADMDPDSGNKLYKYPIGGNIELAQLGDPLPDMIKVDLYMLDSKSWSDLMNCYKFNTSTSKYSKKSDAHEEQAKKILDRKLRYFTKVFYIPKVDTSDL